MQSLQNNIYARYVFFYFQIFLSAKLLEKNQTFHKIDFLIVELKKSQDDEEEIDRISAELRNRGYRVKESTKIIRLALRLAFRDLSEKELDQVNYDLAEKWKQGSTGGKTTKTT